MMSWNRETIATKWVIYLKILYNISNTVFHLGPVNLHHHLEQSWEKLKNNTKKKARGGQITEKSTKNGKEEFFNMQGLPRVLSCNITNNHQMADISYTDSYTAQCDYAHFFCIFGMICRTNIGLQSDSSWFLCKNKFLHLMVVCYSAVFVSSLNGDFFFIPESPLHFIFGLV